MINWTELLRRGNVIPDPCFERPFVCDGFPDASCAVIIGENPATKMGKDWWDYWDEKKGFDYDHFVADYEKARQSVLTTGVSKRGRRSRTRGRLDQFRENGICCLETNVYRNEKSAGAGNKGVSNKAVLNVLLDNMPTHFAIVAHGKPAKEYVCEYESQHGFREGVKVFKTRHFSRERCQAIDDICREIKAICPERRPMPPRGS